MTPSCYGGSAKVRSEKVKRGFENGGRGGVKGRGRMSSRRERVDAKRGERLLVLTPAKAVQ